MSNKLLDAALAYAGKGWAVFPCRANKMPYTLSGVLDATTDAQQIKDWWGKWPGANIAVSCGEAGLLVLDYDPGSSREAVERNVGDLPESKLVARTPRGGLHEYYALAPDDDPVANSASKVAPNVDVRSFHGYVLLPPSRTSDGDYEWLSEGKPAYRTDKLIEVCRPARDRSAQAEEWIIEPDLPENVERARRWLRGEVPIGESKCRLAVEGHGGDNVTYATAAMMLSLGISEETALELMWEEWNGRCSPPWDYDDLAAKVANGYSYNTSPPGNVTPSYHAARVALAFAPRTERLGEQGKEIHAGRFRFTDRHGVAAIEPPSWLLPDFLPEGGYGLLVGAPGSLKTFIALDAALTVATGGLLPLEEGEWKGSWECPEKPGPVLFAIGEGRPALRKRIEAWESFHRGGSRSLDFVVADPVPRISEGHEGLEAFIKGALEMSPKGYRLVVLDTIGRAMQGVNENAQEHASAFTALVEHIQRELGAAVLALHHVSRDREGPRGSTVFEGDADTIIGASRRDPKSKLVKLKMFKQKDAPEWQRDRWLEAKLVKVGMEESSLALVRAGNQERQEEQAEERQESKVRLSLGIVDRYVMAVLRLYPHMELSNHGLSEVVASYQDESGSTIGVTASALIKTWWGRLKARENETQSGAHYDPIKSRWRYSPQAEARSDRPE